MTIKALKSFSGKIAMIKGEVREIEDKALCEDLLRANYVESLSPKTETKASKPKSKSKKEGLDNAGDS